MEFYGNDHVYICEVPGMPPEVKVHMLGSSLDEIHAQEDLNARNLANYVPEEAFSQNQQRIADFVQSKLKKVEGITVDGKPVEDYQTIFKTSSLALLASWLRQAAQNPEILKRDEVKNS